MWCDVMQCNAMQCNGRMYVIMYVCICRYLYIYMCNIYIYIYHIPMICPPKLLQMGPFDLSHGHGLCCRRRTVQQIRASDYAFAAVLSDQSVITWGHHSFGGNSSRCAPKPLRISPGWGYHGVIHDWKTLGIYIYIYL